MKKRKIHIWMLVCLLSFSGFLLSYGKTYAASATISLTEPKEVVKSGDTFTVIVVIQSSEPIGNVEAFVSFEKDKVSFESGGLFATAGDGLVMIRDWDKSDESTRKKYPLTFKAKKDGECRFETSNDASVYDAATQETMSVSCVNLNLMVGGTKNESEETVEDPEVKEKTTDKVSYPSLETLTVSNGILAPLFEPEIYQYEIEVDNKVESLKISAVPKDKGDKVEIEGNENLEEGLNKVTITVTSAFDRTRVYTIQVTKNDEKPVNEEEENTDTSEIQCTKQGDVLTLSQTLKLTVETPDRDDIPLGFEQTSIRIDGQSVPAYMKAEDLKADTYLIYGTDQNGNTGFYQYNRLTKRMEPMSSHVGNADSYSQPSDTLEANFQLIIVVFILGVVCIVLSVLLALQLFKKRHIAEEENNMFDEWKY